VIEAVMADQVIAVVTQQLLDDLAAVLVRPKFRRWLGVADAVAFVETLGGKADLRPQQAAGALRRSRDQRRLPDRARGDRRGDAGYRRQGSP